jgi:hypothetical protein
MLLKQLNEGYREFATEKQWEIYKAYCEFGSQKAAGEKLGKTQSTVQQSLVTMQARAAKRNFDPQNGSVRPTAEGFEVHGTSTMTRNEFGEIQWVKTKQTMKDLTAKIEAACKVMAEEVRGTIVHPPLADVMTVASKLTVYPIPDLHIGMLAWGKECGEDQDVRIIKELATEAIDSVIGAAPKSEHAVVCFMGDYFHSDTDDNETRASGNKLDCDGRVDKVFDEGVRLARDIIAKVAAKHNSVTVIVLPGNHDEYLCVAMKYVLQAVYENDYRIHLEMTHGMFAYQEFGNTLIAFHHGHTTKIDRLASIIAEDQRAAWGRVKQVHCLTGHIHHQSVKDVGTCKIESFRTLCAKDEWAASHGYRSARSLYSIAYDFDKGECGRAQYNVIPDATERTV